MRPGVHGPGGAVPAPLYAGSRGLHAVSIAGGGDFLVQLIGVAAIGAFVFAASWAIWSVLKLTVGARTSPLAENLGQDVAELGIEAYPEFVVLPESDD